MALLSFVICYFHGRCLGRATVAVLVANLIFCRHPCEALRTLRRRIDRAWRRVWKLFHHPV